MSLTTVIFIAFGLAMDAFAVSITSGIAIRNLKIKHAMRISISFGLFQAVMPVIGWLAGFSLKSFISSVDHWIAFGLLSFIGCKMIYESVKLEESQRKANPLDVGVILMLSIATSIDALAVGISFAFLEISIVTPVIIIGVITFLLSLFGVLIGDKLGHSFRGKIEIIGGLILIGIGAKILVEHL